MLRIPADAPPAMQIPANGPPAVVIPANVMHGVIFPTLAIVQVLRLAVVGPYRVPSESLTPQSVWETASWATKALVALVCAILFHVASAPIVCHRARRATCPYACVELNTGIRELLRFAEGA